MVLHINIIVLFLADFSLDVADGSSTITHQIEYVAGLYNLCYAGLCSFRR